MTQHQTQLSGRHANHTNHWKPNTIRDLRIQHLTSQSLWLNFGGKHSQSYSIRTGPYDRSPSDDNVNSPKRLRHTRVGQRPGSHGSSLFRRRVMAPIPTSSDADFIHLHWRWRRAWLLSYFFLEETLTNVIKSAPRFVTDAQPTQDNSSRTRITSSRVKWPWRFLVSTQAQLRCGLGQRSRCGMRTVEGNVGPSWALFIK